MHCLYLAGAVSNVDQGTDYFTLRRFVALPVSLGKLWCCTSYHIVCKALCTSLSIKYTACLNSCLRCHVSHETVRTKKTLCYVLTLSSPMISVYIDTAICNSRSSIFFHVCFFFVTCDKQLHTISLYSLQ
jgi:hypothetical protein